MADEAQLGAEEVELAPEDMAGLDDDEELARMKEQLANMEQEAKKLQEMQKNAQQEAGLAPSSSSDAAKEEVDARSVYVGNVDYACTPEELQAHFQECGTVNRVTILTDRSGNPKGFAYVEFLEADAVEAACLLEGSELRGRQLKVQPKRTNVPGLKASRGRGRGRGRGGFFMPMMPPPFMYGFGYGYAPRGRGRGRGRGAFYAPY